MTTVLKKFSGFAAALLMLAASPAFASDNDPLEPYNRAMFDFNHGADTYLIKPVAQGYRYVTPQVVRTHLGNFAANLNEPLNMINAVLQGDVTQGATSMWRFIINSTIGIAGLNDVATVAGLTQRTEDFGQTLAVWGVGSGPYIVLPLLGPSNGRDTIGLVGDWGLNPITYLVDDWTQVGIYAGQVVIRREQLLETADDIYNSSLDPYVTFRTIYEQHRAAQIKNRYSEQPTSPLSIN